MQTVNIDEKPYYEIIAGSLVAKYGPMTPQRIHGRLTLRMANLLNEWVGTRGEANPEWRFRMPSDETRESYIPDVSLLFYNSAVGLSDGELEKPRLAPDIAVEIRSPDDKPARLAYKIAVMLANGTRLVIDVVPEERRIRAHSRDGIRDYADGEIFSHEAAPGFVFDISIFFDSAKPNRS